MPITGEGLPFCEKEPGYKKTVSNWPAVNQVGSSLNKSLVNGRNQITFKPKQCDNAFNVDLCDICAMNGQTSVPLVSDNVHKRSNCIKIALV